MSAQPDPSRARWAVHFWWIAAPIALLLVATTVYGMAMRVSYPFDLEWMEGGQLAHAWRILHGRPLYPEPGVEWIPYIYPPGYSAIVAAFGSVFGLSPTLGRLVSWVGTALCLGSIVGVVGRQSRGPDRWWAGVGAAVVFLGCWSATGAFLDLVRPDALALGLWMAALVLAMEKRPSLHVLGGLLLAAAFAVKHPMAAWGLPIALGLWVRDGRPWAGLRFGLAALIPAVVLTIWLQWSTGGTFLTYLLVVPSSHPIVSLRMLPGVPWEWGTVLPVAAAATCAWAAWRATVPWSSPARWAIAVGVGAVSLAVGVGVLWVPEPRGVSSNAVGAVLGVSALVLVVGAGLLAAVSGLRRRALDRRWVLAAGVGLVGLVVAGWMRGHVGGFVNVLLPLYALTAVGFGLMLAHLSRSTLGTAVASILLAGQLGWAWWSLDVQRLIPTAEDRQAGERIVDLLAQEPGPVFSPVAPWMAVQAGHEPGPHLIAIWDTGNHRDGPWPGTRLKFEQAVANQYWGTIVDGRVPVGFGVDGRYTLGRRFVLGPRLRPRTGYTNSPVSFWSR